ncbi:toxin [Streptomyces sp. NRRL WC-3753]|nr:toxin [Streptomyces sp. NRRL WC-3753]
MIRKTSSGDVPDLAWFKSSYSSGAETDSCVEVATTPSTVHIRDSKNLDGPRLTVTPTAWAGFLPYATEG